MCLVGCRLPKSKVTTHDIEHPKAAVQSFHHIFNMEFTISDDFEEDHNFASPIKIAKLRSKSDLFTRRRRHESCSEVIVDGGTDEDELTKRNRKQPYVLSKFKDYHNVSVKHKTTFQKLFQLREGIKSSSHGDFKSIEEVHGNSVYFHDEFLIGRGSCGTEVYICLGPDGTERAIKRLPKHLCKKFLKNERDILRSPKAVNSPHIVNYFSYDETSSPDFGYVILDLHEQNLEEYLKAEGKTMTETSAGRMIRQVLQGLKALHSREPRILHRNLKPTNILVDVNGDLALSDFGIGPFFPVEGIYFVFV